MATIIDAFVVTIGLDPKAWIKGKDYTERSQKQFRDNTKKTGIEIGDSLAALGRQAGALFLGFESVKGAVSWLAGLSVGAANLGRFSANVGISAHAVNAWDNAVELAGGSAKDAEADLMSLSASLTALKATGDVSPLILFLQRMGVAAFDAKGNVRNLTDVYKDLGDKLRQYNRADAFNLARGAGISESTFNLIRAEASERQRMLDIGEKNAGVTDDEVRKAQQLQEEWRDIGQEATKLGQEINGDVAPAVKSVLDEVKLLFAADGTQSGIATFFKGLAGSINIVVDSFKILKSYWGDGSFLNSVDETLKDSWIGKTIGVLVNPLGSLLNAGKGDLEAAGAKASGPAAPGNRQARTGVIDRGSPPTAASGSRFSQNNNPGDLRFANQPGATEGAGGFAAFPTLGAGIRAANRQLDIYASRGINTISSIISKWAPSSENDTSGYIAAVSKALGKDANAQLSAADRQRLLQSIFNKEGVNKGITVPSIDAALGGNGALNAARFATSNSQPSQASGGGGAAGGNTQVQIDSITVHTQATDASGMAAELPGALKRRGVVAQADQGMS